MSWMGYSCVYVVFVCEKAEDKTEKKHTHTHNSDDMYSIQSTQVYPHLRAYNNYAQLTLAVHWLKRNTLCLLGAVGGKGLLHLLEANRSN